MLDDERRVHLPSPAHRHVELLGGHLLVDEHDPPVDRRALRLVDGERVAEGDVLGYVPRRKRDAPASLEALDDECALEVALDDAPALAVADELTGSPPELAVVLQGHDLVADTRPPVRDRCALALDLAAGDEVLPAASRQRVDGARCRRP